MKNDYLYLEDALESIVLVNKYINGINVADFVDNSEKQNSVIRRIELIGEAFQKPVEIFV